MAGLSDISLGNFTEIAIGPEDSYSKTALIVMECVQSVGDISDEATIADVSCYGQKYLRKLVGSANASPIEVVANYNPTDPTQQDCLVAYQDGTPRSMAIIMNETEGSEPSLVGDKDGHHICFKVLVASATVNNSFDETRTITFSMVPTDGIIYGNGLTGGVGSDGYHANPFGG